MWLALDKVLMALPKPCLAVTVLCFRGHNTSPSSTGPVVSCRLPSWPTLPPPPTFPFSPRARLACLSIKVIIPEVRAFLSLLYFLSNLIERGTFLILKFLPAGETWDKEQFYFLIQEVWTLGISSKFFLHTEKPSSAFLSSHTLSYSALRSQMTLSVFFLELYQFNKFIYLYFRLP